MSIDVYIDRVLTIPEATFYDAGKYLCIVERLNGLSTDGTVDLILHGMREYIQVSLKP